MPTITTIASKLSAANSQLQTLQLYPQDASVDINTMLNDILAKMWTDITSGQLTQDEMDLCIGTFANAIITNLVDRQAQTDLDLLFMNTLACYSANKFDAVYLSQILRANKMPEPSSKCIYVAGDVTDAAKNYDINRDAQSKSALLATLGAFYNNASAMYVLMDDDLELDNFKNLINPMLQAKGLDPFPADFNLQAKISDGVILRPDYKLSDQSNDPDSNARIVMSVLTNAYANQILPTRTIDALIPQTVVFFNARKLARATSTEIMNAKSDIGKLAGIDKARILSFSQMASLSQVAKIMNKMAVMNNQLNNILAKSALSQATGKFVIRHINMKRVQKKLERALKTMKDVAVSKNPREHEYDTYQRPNRRDPENWDLPGTVTDFGYCPDIHLYVDTSGSISQKDYEDSVAMLVDIAKKFNCDIYFNSFTTDISQETLVKCRDKSKHQIQKAIEKIPKLSGGTTIDQVWQYINCSKKNRRQLSVLISDFYVDVPRYIKHPDHLFYIPTKDTSVKYAEEFANKLPNPWRVLF